MEKEKRSLEIARLLFRELQEGNDPEAREKLNAWLDEHDEHRALFEWVQKDMVLKKELGFLASTNTDKAWNRFNENIGRQTAPVKRLGFWQKPAFRIAASVIIVIGLATWLFWFIGKPESPVDAAAGIIPEYKNDVDPGGNRAMLTLANGSVVELEEAANGTISLEGSTEVKKLSSGELVYVRKGTAAKAEIGSNILSTPRGGQYHVVLPDGSEVWLNAATTLTYPTAFVGTDREVKLEGEAFFEIKKDAGRPFRVITAQQKTTVLGTRFNVSAYADDPAEIVTLSEGKVRVSATDATTVGAELMPGQEAIVRDQIFTRSANIEMATAWKNGIFFFEETDLSSIMRQLGRWYNVEVKFANQEIKAKFNGKIPRNLSLNNVLKVLELSDVKFRVEGKVITVL